MTLDDLLYWRFVASQTSCFQTEGHPHAVALARIAPAATITCGYIDVTLDNLAFAVGFFKQIKSVQLNDEKIFRSKSPDGVRQEFWAHLAVHYATMCVQVDAADHAKLDPDRISHKNTVRIIRSRMWMPESFPPLG
jgi:hypothetical protein